ncbi:hypothetical protein [Cryptosporangium sp. NPDC051539]|uniref:hypothetical protein n=1 Tax=Cryptosporangium sp. NPDC051539 TaxID=3363962 RepID=UPI0037B24634
MSGQFDVSIKAVRAVDKGTNFTVDDVPAGTPFDVTADFEVGSAIRAFTASYTVRTTIRNTTTYRIVARETLYGTVEGSQATDPLLLLLRIPVPAGWTAEPGDVLDVQAVLIYRSGAATNSSHVAGPEFLVA